MDKQTDEQVFIGARSLEKGQIYKIMPTYDSLLSHIEQIRDSAASSRNHTSKGKKDINNTIGIFGERGTGKTSALYTVEAHLLEEKRWKQNIVLPLIEPDNFGENTKIMGSIVGLLEKKATELLSQFEKNNASINPELKDFYNNCILKQHNELRQKIDELIEYHLYTENEYRKMLTQHYDDLAAHIKKSSRLLIPDIEFKKRLNACIDTLCVTQKQLYELEQEVLLFIFIDDIDLKTSKYRELVSSLLQYTDHPNVVTILSGDYDIFSESLTLMLLADEKLGNLGLTVDHQESILVKKEILSHEYLKK